jgi:uncharacterized protein (DUF4415 family)
MPTKKRAGEKPLVDPDDAPELTDEYFRRADVYEGKTLVRRGRPPLERPKQAIKLRLSQDVIEHFRATGPGWQTRINETLEGSIKPPKRRRASSA